MTIETFNASVTWTCPTGVTSVQAETWGGGGGGSDALYHYYLGTYNRSGGGGGGGAYSKKMLFLQLLQRDIASVLVLEVLIMFLEVIHFSALVEQY